MKKFISMFMLTIMMMVSSVANAQSDKQNYAGNSNALDNISIGILGGVQTNLHDWNAPQGGLWGIIVNKEITPIWGVSAEVGMGFNNNANWKSQGLLGEGVSRHMKLSHGGTQIENLYTFGDVRFNISNAIGGYLGKPRVVEVEAVGGVGYAHGFVTHGNGPDAFLAKAGAQMLIYPTRNRSWSINVRPQVIWDINHAGNCMDSRNAVFEAMAGLTYYFTTSNGTHHFVKAEPIVRTVYETKTVEKVVTKTVPVTTNSEVGQQYVVNFSQGSATIGNLSELTSIKAKKVTVDGYASPEGTSDGNLALAQKRADAVKTYLESKGIEVVSAVGHSTTESTNRIVVVTVKE